MHDEPVSLTSKPVTVGRSVWAERRLATVLPFSLSDVYLTDNVVHSVNSAATISIWINKRANVRITYKRGAFDKPLSQWMNNKDYVLWVCVCSLCYTLPKAHALYYIIWLSHNCPQSHERHDYRIKVTGKKTCVLIFSKLLSEPFPILRKNSARYYHKSR